MTRTPPTDQQHRRAARFTDTPWIDLNGYDQTIAELEMVEVIAGSTQTIRSDTPAMLTISNDTDTVTARQGGRIVG